MILLEAGLNFHQPCHTWTNYGWIYTTDSDAQFQFAAYIQFFGLSAYIWNIWIYMWKWRISDMCIYTTLNFAYTLKNMHRRDLATIPEKEISTNH